MKLAFKPITIFGRLGIKSSIQIPNNALTLGGQPLTLNGQILTLG